MRSSLGVSLGTANLVTVVDGRPTVRPAAVTVRPGLAITGFVDRVGDPVPMLAADGSAHHADRLAAAAIETATRHAAPRRRPDVAAVAVPAHWTAGAVAALRAQAPHLQVVSDATAALTAVAAGPGLPARGVVVLCDVGASGTGITLADAGADLAVIGQSVRCDELSGDLVDQALLRHVVDGLDADPAGTSAVASLIDLRAACRAAKERLSDATATALAGPHAPIRVTRAELQSLIAGPLDRLVVAVLDLLHRHRIAPADLAAVVTVGGGSRIPLVTQRLSEALRCPVITAPQPQAAAAIGAELIALQAVAFEAPTALAPAAATMLAPAATPLAWSAEDADADDTDEAATAYALLAGDAARPEVHFDHDTAAEDEPRRRRSPLWLAGAACVAAVAVAGVVLTAEIARGDGTVATGASDIATPVATHALEPAAQPAPAPPVDPVTQTVLAAPAPQPVAGPAPVAAPAQQQQQVVAKQGAPQPAPVPAAPAPAPAPVPAAPAPAAPAPVWPRIPLPQFTFPSPTPRPAPSLSPAPSPSPAPEQSPAPEPSTSPEPSPSSSPEPEPSATAAPSPSAEETAACVPSAETTC